MAKPSLLLTALAATPVWSRTVHSVIVFNRHGDSMALFWQLSHFFTPLTCMTGTSKFYPNYQMTSLGAQQCYDSGSYYRSLYLNFSSPSYISGISEETADFNQLWASAPDQPVLFQTALNFMQGLYPPLSSSEAQVLANGTTISAPLDGYQYIHIQGEDEKSPDTIWLKGDDECPTYENASKAYRQSSEYLSLMESTQDFYTQFSPLLSTILDGEQNLTYKNAYNIFDLLNTAKVQNSTIADQISDENLNEARYLANTWEFNHNYNSSEPDRSIGGEALAGGILRQMSSIMSDSASTKFSLMTGSYDTFLALFGLVGLPAIDPDFEGLPNYAASIAFEMFSEADDAEFVEEDLRVRFLFRNGTESGEELRAWPLFGLEEESLGYGEFVERMGSKAIMTVGEWCGRCQAEADFCLAEDEGAAAVESGDGDENHDNGLSLAGAEGIGAGVTLAVVAIVGLLAWMLMRKRRASTAAPVMAERMMSDAESGSGKESV
ncbi:Lysosomal acid phosphatase [Pseudocercospora fuligena]|uniref:Lysosomal acid phosphatase n=1 Tax=Pseudocercospora fuligena TaxID=685502 RepID=A0A8H6RJF2_9PEZI|nr:Lysosomal acid phosphatase [Pseudocercospora fuligena]